MTQVIEEWKPVVGYEGWYEVSSFGNVKRVKHYKWLLSGMPLTPVERRGRLNVTLSKENRVKIRPIHVLVAAAFIGPRPEGLEINHIDGNRYNNRATNLEYITHTANYAHAVAMGLMAKGESNPSAKLTVEQVREIRAMARTCTYEEIARIFNVDQSNVYCIVKRKTWKHVA